jgi:peptide-methionine (R)-S-oxide reductase
MHNILRVTVKPRAKKSKRESKDEHLGDYRTWPSFNSFKTWRNKHLKLRREALRDRLTPLEYYVTQGSGYERPFTGEHWWSKDVGMYSCRVCT